MILARMRCYAEAGARVRLLLTQYGPNEQNEEAAVRKAWSLPDSVTFSYFWRDAAPSCAGAAGNLPARHRSPDLTATTERTAKARFVHLRDGTGTLVETEISDRKGRLVRVDRYDREGAVIGKEQFDPRGRLVLSDHLEPGDTTPTMRRWFDASGACWLTTWLNQEGRARQTVRHLPEPVGYDHFGHCVAEWVDSVIADSPAPVVFSDTREQDVALLAMRHPTARRVIVAHSGHTTKPHRAEDPAKENYRPLLENLDRVDALVVLTERQRRHLVARYADANPFVINNATPPVPDVQPRREPGLLVAVARLAPEKRLQDAIRAFATAARRVPHARFDIYGNGPQRAQLHELATELGVADKVRFLGFTNRPLEVLASGSATVLTSSYEGWGLVLTEAMAVGTPVVAYDINYGPSEIIRDEVDGLLVPSGDTDRLAEGLVRLLGDQDYAARLGERAREVRERFTEQRWRRDWLHLLDTLTRQRSGDTPARPAARPSGAGTPTPKTRRTSAERSVEFGRQLYRSAREAARPVLREARSIRTGARLVPALLAERRRGRTVVVLVCDGTELTMTAVSRSIRTARVLGTRIEALILDYLHDTGAKQRLSSLLSRPPGQLLVPYPVERDDAPRARATDVSDRQAPAPVPDREGNWWSGYYRDGSPVFGVGRRHGRETVYCYGPAGLPVRREENNEHGATVRIAELEAGTGMETDLRYLDGSGECWLSVTVGPAGERGETTQYRPVERRFRTFRDAQREYTADWLDQRGGQWCLLAVDRAGEVIAAGLDRPSIALPADGTPP